jgi:hypothetical protein
MWDKLSLAFISDKEGEAEVSARLTFAPDYGKFNISLNGHSVSQVFDGYNDKLLVKTLSLGRFNLKKGENILEISVAGTRPNEKKTAFFGLDYLMVNQ